MEASEQEVVSREDEEISEPSRKILECLIRHREDTHMTLGRVAGETRHDVRGIGPAIASLKRRGMVLERRDDSMGQSYYRVPAELLATYPLICTEPGCDFIAKSAHGLAIHSSRKHKLSQVAAQPVPNPEEEPEEEDEPEVLEQAGPDVAEILKAFENGANEIRKLGWQVEVQVRLNFPSIEATKGAS